MKNWKYILAGAVYAGILLGAVFTLGGKPYFVLMDDEMISMYYARTGFAGIEGYSNPLWTAIMIPCQLLPRSLASLPIAIINLACIIGIMKHSKHPLLLGLTFPIIFWAVRGTEFIPIAFLLFYGLKTKKAAIPIILITLLRVDGFIIAGILLACRWSAGNLAAYIGATGAIFGARYAHYGEVFSNTYYLKMGYPIAERIERSFQGQNWIYFLAPWEYAAPITLIFLYNAFIGGDAWEQYAFLNRFLVMTVPMFYEIGGWRELGIVRVAGWGNSKRSDTEHAESTLRSRGFVTRGGKNEH